MYRHTQEYKTFDSRPTEATCIPVMGADMFVYNLDVRSKVGQRISMLTNGHVVMSPSFDWLRL